MSDSNKNPEAGSSSARASLGKKLGRVMSITAATVGLLAATGAIAFSGGEKAIDQARERAAELSKGTVEKSKYPPLVLVSGNDQGSVQAAQHRSHSSHSSHRSHSSHSSHRSGLI